MSVSLILEDGKPTAKKGVWNSPKSRWMSLPFGDITGNFPQSTTAVITGNVVRARVDEGVMENAILAPQQALRAMLKAMQLRWW